MTIKKHLNNAIGKTATRRTYKAAPWVGGALAFWTLYRNGTLISLIDSCRTRLRRPRTA